MRKRKQVFGMRRRWLESGKYVQTRRRKGWTKTRLFSLPVTAQVKERAFKVQKDSSWMIAI